MPWHVVPARSLGGGIYEASVAISSVATYYVFVGSQSEELEYNDMPFFSLMGLPPQPNSAPQAAAEGGS